MNAILEQVETRRQKIRLKDIPYEKRTFDLCVDALVDKIEFFGEVPQTIDLSDVLAAVLAKRNKAITTMPRTIIGPTLFLKVDMVIKFMLMRRKPFLYQVAGQTTPEPKSVIAYLTERKFTDAEFFRLERICDHEMPLVEEAISEQDAIDLLRIKPIIIARLPPSKQRWDLFERYYSEWFIPHLRKVVSPEFWIGFARSKHFRRQFLDYAPDNLQWPQDLVDKWVGEDPRLFKFLNGTQTSAELAIEKSPWNIRHIKEPSVSLCLLAVRSDHTCAKVIRRPELPKSVLDAAVLTRFRVSGKKHAVMSDEDQMDVLREEIVMEHAFSYSRWVLDDVPQGDD